MHSETYSWNDISPSVDKSSEYDQFEELSKYFSKLVIYVNLCK